MKSILKFTTLLLFFILASPAKASHLSSIWITYTQINNDTFRLEFNIVRDCSGVGGASSLSFAANACGTTLYGSASLESIYEIPMGYLTSQSTCNGGTIPGYEVYSYADTLVFPTACDTFTFSWGSCCYPLTINYPNLGFQASSERYVAQNSSAHFSPPYNYTLEGDTAKTYKVGLGVYDIDGDSVVFELTNPPNSSGPLTPNLPYTSANPYPWISLDSITGQMTVTPPGMGKYLAYMKVYDYDTDGTLKGTTDRSFLFTFNPPTTSSQVLPLLDSVTNVTGASYANQIFTTTPGNSTICFDLIFSDTNIADTINLSSNIAEALPGATVTVTGTNPITASVCWTYSLATGSHYHFKSTLQDECNTCGGFSDVQEYEFLIKTWGTLPSVQDSATICQGSSYQINAGTADSINWSVISGDPMVIGTNFSCDSCSSPTASPAVTTTYQVWGQTQGYISIDTITISVESPMTSSGLQSTSTICEGSTIWLDANSGFGGVSWLDYLGDSLIVGQNIGCVDCDSTWFTPSDTSSIIYTANLGGLCEFKDTITVNILHLPSSILSSTIEFLCDDDSATISIPNVGSFQWNSISGSPINPSTIQCDTCGNVWTSPDSNSVWQVTYAMLPGCQMSDTITFEHNYLTPSGLSTNLDICEGDSVLISSNSTGYHSWSYLNSMAFIGINISSITGDSTQIFPIISDYLLAFNTTGTNCFQIDTIAFTIQDLQADLGLANGATICVGDSVNLNTTANASVQWTTLMGAPINVGTNFNCDTCANAIASPNQSTIYQVTNTYFTGCFELDTMAVSVNDSTLIYGTVVGQGLIGTTLFNNSLVTLYQYNGTNWVIEDTTLTDSNGYFYFYTSFDSVLVSGEPNQNLYPGTATYYYGNQPNQSMASVIQTTACGSNDASILIPILVGVEDIENSDISVFPIPNHGEFTISSTHKGTYEIYTVTGALIQSGKLNTGNNSITLTNANGNYFVHINRNNKTSIIQIIVE